LPSNEQLDLDDSSDSNKTHTESQTSKTSGDNPKGRLKMIIYQTPIKTSISRIIQPKLLMNSSDKAVGKLS